MRDLALANQGGPDNHLFGLGQRQKVGAMEIAAGSLGPSHLGVEWSQDPDIMSSTTNFCDILSQSALG